MMLKRVLSIFLIALCLFSFAETANAGNFITLAETGILNLGKDEKWEKKYETKDGVFKIRLRKLRFGPDRKRYHLIIWRNDERILDGYSPQNDIGYGISVFKEAAQNRLFFCISGYTRTQLFGFEPKNKKLEKYVDNVDYYSPYEYSFMTVDEDNDLRLVMTNGNNFDVQYKLFWVPENNWFGYRDMTVHHAAPESDGDEEYYEDYTDDEIYVAPQPSASRENDIFYEDVEVVGS